MKKAILFTIVLTCLLLVIGCQKSQDKTVKIKVDGGKFPSFLVGTWRATEAGWEFKFEPDGTISSAVIDGGMVAVNPSEKTTEINLKDGGKGTYKLGQWSANYTPLNRELSVMLNYEYYLDMKTHALRGMVSDWLMGSISEDGQTWKAQWITTPQITLFTPEPSVLPIDPNEMDKGLAVFKKLPQK